MLVFKFCYSLWADLCYNYHKPMTNITASFKCMSHSLPSLSPLALNACYNNWINSCCWLQAEISLCRVYKRAGVEDHPSLPRTLPTTRATSSRHSNTDKRQHSQNLLAFHSYEAQNSNQNDDKLSETSGSSTTDIAGTALGLSSPINPSYNNYITPFQPINTTLTQPSSSNIGPLTASSSVFPNNVDDLHRIISYQQASVNNPASQAFHIQNYQPKFSNNLFLQPQPQLQPQQLQQQSQHQQALLSLNNLAGEGQVNFPDRLWDWNPTPSEGNKDYTNPFK